MGEIKKFFIRGVCFLLIFAALFMGLQYVLHYRWANEDKLYTRYMDYASVEEGSADVVYFGTSELYTGINPLAMYNAEGITGYNLTVTDRSAITQYYQVLYALKTNRPKVVACDFMSLIDQDGKKTLDELYRKNIAAMPDARLKREMINAVAKEDENQTWLALTFPLLRYHNMWNTIEEKNFRPDLEISPSYEPFTKGCWFVTEEFVGDPYDIVPALWDPRDDAEVNLAPDETAVKYYDLLIQACRERDVPVVAIFPPIIGGAWLYQMQWDVKEAYFDSRGIDYLNYDTYEEVKRMDLNWDDYWDNIHLNVRGSVKFSEVVARDLKEKYGLTDHRAANDLTEDWDAEWEEFESRYLTQ